MDGASGSWFGDGKGNHLESFLKGARQVTARITCQEVWGGPALPHKRCQLRLQGPEEQREPRGASGPRSTLRQGCQVSGFRRMRTLWIVAVWLMSVDGSLIEFGKMIFKETGKIPFPFYTSYGCYCGSGGRGKPKDATDRCCFVHDCCYEKLRDCSPKTDRYKYHRENGAIVCESGTSCEKRICECDKAAAICFRENLKTYKKKYMFYPDIFCKEDTEKC